MTSKAIWLLDIDGVINACPEESGSVPRRMATERLDRREGQ